VSRTGNGELTQTPLWLCTWWRIFGTPSRNLCVGTLYDGDRLIGLMPLRRRVHWYRGVLPFRRLEFLGSGEPANESICTNHLNVLAEQGREAIVAERFVDAINHDAFGAWDEVVLPMMNGDGPMPSLLTSAFRAAGVHVDLQTIACAPYAALPANWDAYLQSLSKNHRHKIRRSLESFDEWSAGAYRMECISSPADLERGKQILGSLHRDRWAIERQPSAFEARRFREFHNELMSWLAERNGLEILVLRAREEPIAVLYNMIWRNKVYSYQTGRRLDLPPHLSPGRVLDALAIQRAIAQGRREFDFLADDAQFKRIFATGVRPLVQVRAARATWRDRIRRVGKRITQY
jgi:CelD/BcsL family acetyltransferase involved in cellulose biosynthesis